MKIEDVMHPTDVDAINALKKVKGFEKITSLYMKYGIERISYMQNASTNIRMSPTQLPEVYNMLPPICEKFGIKEPEIYLNLSRLPGAVSYGEERPYINISSGLLETCTKEEIQVAIARECGHIACHHGLYQELGTFVLMLAGGVEVALLGPVSGIASALVAAGFYKTFAYWLRCSDLTADRFATLWSGKSDVLISYIARCSGLTQNLGYTLNIDEYKKQLDEFKEFKNSETWNKALHFLKFSDNTTYTNAERVIAINEWCNTPQYMSFMKGERSISLLETAELVESAANQKFCPFCGIKLNQDSSQKFCTNCGNKLRSGE